MHGAFSLQCLGFKTKSLQHRMALVHNTFWLGSPQAQQQRHMTVEYPSRTQAMFARAITRDPPITKRDTFTARGGKCVHVTHVTHDVAKIRRISPFINCGRRSHRYFTASLLSATETGQEGQKRACYSRLFKYRGSPASATLPLRGNLV